VIQATENLSLAELSGTLRGGGGGQQGHVAQAARRGVGSTLLFNLKHYHTQTRMREFHFIEFLTYSSWPFIDIHLTQNPIFELNISRNHTFVRV
jgi:hypothetical protein